MPRSNKQMVKNLQKAINTTFDVGLLVDKVQWYSEKQNRAVTVHKVKILIPEDERVGSTKYKELFSTVSEIQLVLFLRDYWFELNGWDIPHDNPMWEQVKEQYKLSHTEFIV